MAKDDYAVIAYYILSYLYACVKQGIAPRREILELREYPQRIEASYAEYVLIRLCAAGYIDGMEIMEVPILGAGKRKTIRSMAGAEITPLGIEFLEENSRMKKAYDTLKAFRDLIPFI